MKLWDMEDTSELNSPSPLPLNDRMEYHRPNTSRVDNGIVSQLDWHAFWGIVAQLMTMGGSYEQWCLSLHSNHHQNQLMTTMRGEMGQ